MLLTSELAVLSHGPRGGDGMLQACFLGNAPRMGGVLCFQGWPKLLWFVTESKHLSKPPRDWFPHIKDANNDTAYIEVGRMRASGGRADSGLAGTAVRWAR